MICKFVKQINARLVFKNRALFNISFKKFNYGKDEVYCINLFFLEQALNERENMPGDEKKNNHQP